MSINARLSSLFYNYSVLRERLTPQHILELMERGLPVAIEVDRRPDLAIQALLFSGPVPEGEISLILSLAGRRVAVLTFTAIPALEFGLQCSAAFLISRVQGYRGAGTDASAIRRDIGVAPPLILMAALEGIAEAFGIHDILGVEAQNHPDFKPEEQVRMLRAYDELFASLGAQQHSAGYYHLALPRPHCPLNEGQSTHPARSRRRRAVRVAITDQARARWKTYLCDIPLLPTSDPTPCEPARANASPLLRLKGLMRGCVPVRRRRTPSAIETEQPSELKL
jgi:uncharacterized protein VirK/YbjX